MKNKIYFLAIISVIIFFTILNLSSCNETPVDPYDKLKPGRRDYVWTIDTIKVGENDLLSLTAIWGSSTNNIWIGGDADTYRNVLWHYNGKVWENHILDKSITIGGFYGTGKNNIWMATTNKSFWKYNGDYWFEFSNFEYPEFGEVAMNSIDGFSNNEIYAVGFAGNTFNEKRTRVAMKFDGNSWKFINIPELDEVFSEVKVETKTKNVFFNTIRFTTPSMPNYLYLLKNNSLIEILHSSESISLGKIKDKVYHVVGSKIYRYIDNELKLFKDLTQYDYAGRMWGRSEKDFFCLTWDFTIAHYNGTDLVDIYKLSSDYFVADAILFENDVFFLCENLNTDITFVLHGKLKK